LQAGGHRFDPVHLHQISKIQSAVLKAELRTQSSTLDSEASRAAVAFFNNTEEVKVSVRVNRARCFARGEDESRWAKIVSLHSSAQRFSNAANTSSPMTLKLRVDLQK
jgi:hypothetical protein